MATNVVVKFLGDGSSLDSAVESSIGKIEQLVGSINPAAAAIAAAFAAVVAVTLTVGSAFQDLNNKIAMSTTATGDKLKELESVANKIYATVPNSLEDVGSAVVGLTQRLDLNGTQVQELSRKYLSLSRITGTDVNTDISSMTRVFKAWGVTADEMGGKIDYLNLLHQKTGVSLDELTGTLIASGAALRGAGFAFDQAASAVARLTSEGLNAESVLASLKLSLSRIAKGSEEVETSTSSAGGSVRNMAHQVAAAEHAIETASIGIEKANEHVADSIDAVTKANNDVVRSQEAVVTAGKSVEDAQYRVGEATDKVTKAQRALDELMKGPTGNTKQKAAEDAEQAAIKVSAAIQKQAQAQWNLQNAQANGSERGVVDGQIALRQANLDLIKAQEDLVSKTQIVNDLNNWSAANDPKVADAKSQLSDAQKQLADTIDRVATAQKNVVDAEQRVVESHKNVQKATENVTDAQRAVVDATFALIAAQDNLTTAQTSGGGSSHVAASGSKALAASLKALGLEGKPAKEVLEGVFTAIKDAKDPMEALNLAVLYFGSKNAPSLVDAIRSGTLSAADFSNAIGGTTSKVEDIDKATRGWKDELKKALHTFEELIGPKLVEIITWLTAEIPKVAEKMQKMGHDFKEAYDKYIKPAVDALTKLITDFWNIFGSTIIDGVKIAFEVVGGVIRGFFEILRGLFEIIDGIITGSWSKVWRGLKDIVQGAWDSVKLVVLTLWNGIKAVWDELCSSFGKPFKAVWDGLKDLVSSGWDKVVGFFKNISPIDGVKDLFKGIPNAFISALNSLIDLWDNFRFPKIQLPDIFGGGSFGGWALPHIDKIPSLATGGLVSMPTLAMVGDAPGDSEIISPTKMMRDIVREEVGGLLQLSSSNSGSGNFHIGEINMNTNATPQDLSRELRWLQMTGGVQIANSR